MNLKDRLIIAKQNTINTNTKEDSYYNDINNIFNNADEAGNIIRQNIIEGRNIMFCANRTFPVDLFLRFIQLLMRDKQINLADKIDENNINSDSKINLIKKANINNTVKIFEYIIYGYKPFVFLLNFNSNDNIIEKLKTVIAVNFPNLDDKNIDTLISESNTLIVNIEKNNTQYFISEINELDAKNNNILISIYKYGKISITKKTETNNIKSSKKEIEISDTDSLDSKLLNYEYKENKIISKSVDIEEQTQEEEETETDNKKQKINKYKLLKEKIKAKKSQ